MIKKGLYLYKKPLRLGGMAPLYCLPKKNYSVVDVSVVTGVVSAFTIVSAGLTGGFPVEGSITELSEETSVDSSLAVLLHAKNPKELIAKRISNFFINKAI